MPEKNCANCRYHSAENREKPVEAAGFDSIVEFGDPQPFYICRSNVGPHAGREIGFDPVHCDSYEPPKPHQIDLDDMIARFEARAAAKGKEG